MREVVLALVFWMIAGPPLAAEPAHWRLEWPATDFTRHSVDLDEIIPGGPPRDGIPAIDEPEFVPVAEATLPEDEPVVGLVVNGDARAYPLRVLIWHEIVNDVVGGVPVAVTYAPFSNTALVFDRRVGGRVLEFGSTGKLRHSGLVMYDRTTESWWQQFLGKAIAGELTGTELAMLPARLESFATFRQRAPQGRVQVPRSDARAYGTNPYVGYDRAPAPFLYHGMLPKDLAPLARVVRVGEEAWSLDLVRQEAPFEVGDLRFTWEPGQASALDAGTIADGKDVGNVLVERRAADGWEDAAYSVDFAFAFHAFLPDGVIHVR
jgi:Protein of unknown function (DUF3179)